MLSSSIKEGRNDQPRLCDLDSAPKFPAAIFALFTLLTTSTFSASLLVPNRAQKKPVPESTLSYHARQSTGAAPEDINIDSWNGHLPLYFVPNRGQSDSTVHFTARSSSGKILFRAADIVFALSHPSVMETEAGTGTPAVYYFTLQFLDSAPQPHIRGQNVLPGVVNYMRGNDPAQWQPRLPTYSEIEYVGLYKGIDLMYEGNLRNLKGTYTLAAGADPRQIRWRYAAAENVRVDEKSGDLFITLAGNSTDETGSYVVREEAPVAWQETGTGRVPVSVDYAIAADQSIHFAIGAYDRDQPLIIDPALVYSTYVGGNALDAGKGIAVDGAGNAYITGVTESPDFPLANPSDSTFGLLNDIFVTKLNTAGDGLIYSTYLGGDGFEDGRAIAVDSNGNAYVTGLTTSNDFPTPNSSTVALGAADAYLAKFDSSGALVYGAYLGGSGNDQGQDIALTGNGDIVVLAQSASTDVDISGSAPVALQAANGGLNDALVLKLDGANPNTLLYGTYFGGSGQECAFFLSCALAVDGNNDIYIALDTSSPTADLQPVHPLDIVSDGYDGSIFHGWDGNPQFGGDAFVLKLNTISSQVVFSTYLGGSGWEEVYAIAVDTNNGIYIVGDTGSGTTTSTTPFPTANHLQAGGFNGNDLHGMVDSFVTKLTWDNVTAELSMDFSTYFGGSSDDFSRGLALGNNNDVHIAGKTSSVDIPTVNELYNMNRGGRDAFVSKFSWNASTSTLTLPFSTYLGADGADSADDLAIDNHGDLYLTGDTDSINFPIANPFHATASGGRDAFVSKITLGTPFATPHSENGYMLSPRGTTRALLVFAEVDYSNCTSQDTLSAHSNWPNILGMTQVPNDADDYFDHYLSPGQQPAGFVTDFYHQASLGQYLLLGDYYPDVIAVDCANIGTWYGTTNVIEQLNALSNPLTTNRTNPITGNNYTLADFDMWGNESSGLAKSNFPNSVIDAIIVIWRNNHLFGGCVTGWAVQNMFSNEPLQDKSVRVAGSYSGCASGIGTQDFTRNEWFHSLFGGNNFHTGSGASNHTFIAPGGAYSVSAQSGANSNAASAWDRFHIGWKNSQKKYLLSALNSSNNETETAITIQSHPNGGRFILRDFYITGDAVRIKLPHLNWQDSNGCGSFRTA